MKHTLVIGAGKSGQAAARFLLQKKIPVMLYDGKMQEPFADSILDLQKRGVLLYMGGQNPPLQMLEQVIISPGVPLQIPLVQEIIRNKIPLLGELEFAYQHAHNPFIAITGTNGKTTTTALVGQMIKDAGLSSFVGGNIGTPLIDVVESLPQDATIVAEVSSFQLETTQNFKPRIGVILNITPDHLDRHGNMENYIAAKASIFARQNKNDDTILNYDDPILRKLAASSPGRVVFFSRKEILPQGVFVEDGKIVVGENGQKTPILPISDIYIKGAHNIENALAAVACGYCLGLKPQSMAHSLVTFTGMPHRLEFVANINDVLYVNDSKGTNPDSTIKAIEAYPHPLLLIAGGYNKNSNYTAMLETLRPKCQYLLLLGETAEAIAETALQVGIPKEKIMQFESLQEVVAKAFVLAQKGDMVLLSPACASWDMFANFEQRGNLFKSLVKEKMGDRNGEKAE